ncbi:hypothetical protein C2U47_01785 [Aeromonas sp. ASNIH7]|nr:hypothetical protein C2U47_01785 [Aeromonas sp. ASNIH7]
MLWLACLNLSGVLMENVLRATMRIAPDCPKKTLGLESLFFCQVISQAGMPCTSSNITVAKPGGCVSTKVNRGASGWHCPKFGMPCRQRPSRAGQLVG